MLLNINCNDCSANTKKIAATFTVADKTMSGPRPRSLIVDCCGTLCAVQSVALYMRQLYLLSWKKKKKVKWKNFLEPHSLSAHVANWVKVTKLQLYCCHTWWFVKLVYCITGEYLIVFCTAGECMHGPGFSNTSPVFIQIHCIYWMNHLACIKTLIYISKAFLSKKLSF